MRWFGTGVRRRPRACGGGTRRGRPGSPRSPPRQTGPTVWITWRAGRSPAVVAFASPVAQPPSRRHSSRIVGPPARWIAPSTPPPPSRDSFAAFTIASTSCCVMSPLTSRIWSLIRRSQPAARPPPPGRRTGGLRRSPSPRPRLPRPLRCMCDAGSRALSARCGRSGTCRGSPRSERRPPARRRRRRPATLSIGMSPPRYAMRKLRERRASPNAISPRSCCSPGRHASKARGP